jgi:hypothetical protein
VTEADKEERRMRYLFEIVAPAERGNEIESKGGPGPFFAYIVERFKPEAMYASTLRRQMWLVVDLASFAQVHELMQICSRATGTEPTITPVVLGPEAAQAIAEATENANKAPTL